MVLALNREEFVSSQPEEFVSSRPEEFVSSGLFHCGTSPLTLALYSSGGKETEIGRSATYKNLIAYPLL